MPTDELLDEFDVDRALRDLLPAMPRSRTWESAKRDELLAYISSGTSGLPASTTTQGVDVEIDVQPGVSVGRVPRPMRRALVGIAAAAVLFAGLVPRWLSTEPGVEAPDDSGVPVESTTSIVPALPGSVLFPDRFPLVRADDPRAAASTANYGGQVGWDNPPSSEALVARLNGDTMTGAVQLQVLTSFDDSIFSRGAPESINIAGTDMKLYVQGGTPTLKTVVLPGELTLAATGLDPVSFLESSGGFPILTGPRVAIDGVVTFAVGDLPDGYELVVGPSGFPLGSVSAVTQAPDGDGGDGISAWVDVHNPLPAYASVGDLQRVDINGVSGWMRDQGPGSPVLWQVSPTTWAYVGGAPTADDAVAFARSLTFVDEATWRARYNVTKPEYSTRDQQLQPPPSTLPEPTELIPDRRTIDADTPEITPVGCGDMQYTDNTVVNPIPAPDPEQALATFLSTPDAKGLFHLGYEEISILSSGHYRFERRNNIDALVTVVFVEPVGNGWAATRWQASPC
jgi:hypothetical protein